MFFKLFFGLSFFSISRHLFNSLKLFSDPPNIKGMHPRASIAPGETTVLKCMSRAFPSPKVEWLHDNVSLLQTSRHFLTADKQLLVIVDTQQSDEGLYTCIVGNELGVRRKSTQVMLLDGRWVEFGLFDNCTNCFLHRVIE